MMCEESGISKRLVLVASLLLVWVLCLPACGGTGVPKTGANPPTETSSSNTSPPSTTMRIDPKPEITREVAPIYVSPDMSGKIAEMLQLLPDNPAVSHDQVWFIDFAAWLTTLGIDRDDYRGISGSPDITSEITYINDLIYSSMDDDRTRSRTIWFPWLGQPPFISGMGKSTYLYFSGHNIQSWIRTKTNGYGPLDIDRSILSAAIDKDSPGNYEAVKGHFDIEAIEGSPEQYKEDFQHPQKSSRDDFAIYSWGSEFSNYDYAFMPPVFDYYGRGHVLAVRPELIFGSQQPARIDEMIDASLDKMPSLADDPRYHELAKKLEFMGNMSAVISVDRILKPDNWPGKSTFFEKAAAYAPPMGPYTACASGLGVDDKGLFVSLVLLYDSPYLATRDIDVLKTRLADGSNSQLALWSEEVDSSEIWSDGNTLCARLYGNVTNYWDCFVYQEQLLARGN
jgi:hypothetical protein